jgi:hypothetical protein
LLRPEDWAALRSAAHAALHELGYAEGDAKRPRQ